MRKGNRRECRRRWSVFFVAGDRFSSVLCSVIIAIVIAVLATQSSKDYISIIEHFRKRPWMINSQQRSPSSIWKEYYSHYLHPYFNPRRPSRPRILSNTIIRHILHRVEIIIQFWTSVKQRLRSTLYELQKKHFFTTGWKQRIMASVTTPTTTKTANTRNERRRYALSKLDHPSYFFLNQESSGSGSRLHDSDDSGDGNDGESNGSSEKKRNYRMGHACDPFQKREKEDNTMVVDTAIMETHRSPFLTKSRKQYDRSMNTDGDEHKINQFENFVMVPKQPAQCSRNNYNEEGVTNEDITTSTSKECVVVDEQNDNEEDEPFPGMVFHVFPSKLEDQPNPLRVDFSTLVTNERSESDSSNTDNIFLGEIKSLQSPIMTPPHHLGLTITRQQQQRDDNDHRALSTYRRPCWLFPNLEEQEYTISDRKIRISKTMVEVSEKYELVERMHGDLGMVDVHSLDYAYRPVVMVPYNHQRKERERRQQSTSRSDWRERRRTSSWQWFGSIFFRYNEQREIRYESSSSAAGHYRHGDEDESSFSSYRHSTEDMYERMGDRAFAGGSHGEVWRARRKCHQVANVTPEKTAPVHEPQQQERKKTLHTPFNDFDDLFTVSPCDDRVELVMKRLKVEHGADLLEAGLREVYFGDMLSNRSSGETSSLFTKYVDHFFHKSSDGMDAVELWIVFENAGPSLRSYMYTPVSSGDFVVYQHSSFWRKLRIGAYANGGSSAFSSLSVVSGVTPQDHWRLQRDDGNNEMDEKEENSSPGGKESKQQYKGSGAQTKESDSSFVEGKMLMRKILKQVLTSAANLHKRGIIHRDIKPSNIMCKTGDEITLEDLRTDNSASIREVNCVIGDFSSAWDEFSSRNLYSHGPTAAEQTNEYAPPEVLFGPKWVPFYEDKPESYDSWSIGVVVLELLLGSPNVFSVDQRTTTLLCNKMKKEGASSEDIQRALYLAALSQFCIYVPTAASEKSWPLREGDPLHKASIVKTTCTIQDFHSALRARDPLGLGFDSSSDALLQLIWGLLAWDPKERLTAAEALDHFYFKSFIKNTLSPGNHNALEPQIIDPSLDMRRGEPDINEYICPKCGKKFGDLHSCQLHATGRRHAKFCTYDRSILPPCLNAHSMLPAHPKSGYCDIQGRRRSIEDFHTVHFHKSHQFYGVFDGHNGNLASKYAASSMYNNLAKRMEGLDNKIKERDGWKVEVTNEIIHSFQELHEGVLDAVASYPGSVMAKSGTTATALFVTEETVVVANVGDSRAILSVGASYDSSHRASSIELTVDHIASNPEERKRIEALGGFVASRGGTARVNGSLVLSRSLGDAHLAQFLSRIPHVVVMTKNELKKECRNFSFSAHDKLQMPCFIVLASDGLWDVISNQEAVDMVELTIQKFDPKHGRNWEEGGVFQEAAQLLTQEAYMRGSTDNIGVCVVAID